MQLLANASEEENVECLGVIPGNATKLQVAQDYPVPNMGWCAVQSTAEHQILNSIEYNSYFYFLHSYALPVSSFTVAKSHHESPFSAIVARDNFVAAQFHPERSSANGAQLLKNFLGTTT